MCKPLSDSMLMRLLVSDACFLFLRQQEKTNANITTPSADPIVAPATVAFDDEELVDSPCAFSETGSDGCEACIDAEVSFVLEPLGSNGAIGDRVEEAERLELVRSFEVLEELVLDGRGAETDEDVSTASVRLVLDGAEGLLVGSCSTSSLRMLRDSLCRPLQSISLEPVVVIKLDEVA